MRNRFAPTFANYSERQRGRFNESPFSGQYRDRPGLAKWQYGKIRFWMRVNPTLALELFFAREKPGKSAEKERGPGGWLCICVFWERVQLNGDFRQLHRSVLYPRQHIFSFALSSHHSLKRKEEREKIVLQFAFTFCRPSENLFRPKNASRDSSRETLGRDSPSSHLSRSSLSLFLLVSSFAFLSRHSLRTLSSLK